MRSITTLVLPTLIMAACSTVALAQTSSTLPKPGPETQKLGIFVGKWSEQGEVKSTPMGEGGKTTGSSTCEWIADRYAILCRESVTAPVLGKTASVAILTYDPEAKSYAFTQVSAGGALLTGRGTVDGDTWIWTVTTTMNGKPALFRFINKWTSPDSVDFKTEAGASADSMSLIADGKQTRMKTPAADPK